jgi:hypothetical protein
MDFTIVRTSFNVTGRVTSDGPALSAARLTIAGPSGGERGPAAARSRVVGVGPDGAFEVRDLPAGRYTVSLVQAAGTRGGQTAIPVTPVTFDVTGRDLTLDLRATPPGPGSTLDSLLDSLQRAANSLQRASSDNKGGFREKAMAEVDQALRDAQAARVFLNDHRDAANEAAVPRAVTPSFMPAGGEGGHPNMFDALRALQDSFETLRQIKGGDLGGNRSRLNSGIAAAAQSVIAGIDVARGIQQATAIAATTPSSLPGKTPLDRTLDALRMAAQSLQRATSNNKGGNREKAIASIEVAIRDVEAARAFLADRPALAELAPAPIAVKPDFGFPQNEVARHTNLNDAFNALRMAFDELSRAPGGDLGGHRSKASASIAATVGSIIDAVRVANGLP